MESSVSVDEVPATGFSVTSTDGSVTAADCAASVTGAGHYKVECKPGTLAAGVTVRITLNFRPSPNTTLPDFDVTGTSSADNWAGGPESSSDTVNVLPTADLQLVKTSEAGVVNVGDTVEYKIDVTNNGPRDSGAAVEVTDVVPAGMAVVSATWADDQSGSGNCAVRGREIICLPAGPVVPSAGSGIKDITVTVRATIGSGLSGPIANCATAVSVVRDPDASNNTSCHEVTILPWAELRLTKLGPTSMKPGGTGTFNLEVTNTGPSDAAGVKVVDDFPKGLTPVSPLPSGCTTSGQRVTCTVGGLLQGASQQLAVTAKASSSLESGQHLQNVASAVADTPGKSAEATDVVPIIVASAAGNGISTKIVGPRTAKPIGSIFNLKVSVTAGRSTARNTTLCATLPGNVSYLSSSGRQSGNRVCWRVGNLKARATKSYSISVMATASGSQTASSAARANGSPRATDSTTVRVYGGFTG